MFEYQIDYVMDSLRVDSNKADEFSFENYDLNIRGHEGWELVSVVFQPETETSYERYMYYYKRAYVPRHHTSTGVEL